MTSGNIQGKYQYGPEAWNKLSDNERAKGIELKPGDVKWKDVNGDGMIDQYDQVVIGNTTPRWYGGFNTTMSWKGLSLYARFDFALDYWVYDDKTPWFLGCMQGAYNTTKDVFIHGAKVIQTQNIPVTYLLIRWELPITIVPQLYLPLRVTI